jgi:kexin
MQYLALNAAQPIHPIDNEQYEVQTTAIGKKFSHTFAYGKLDAEKIVALAKDWKLVKPQAWFYSPWQHVKQDLPQGDEGLVVSFEVTKDMLKDANFERVEHVTVTMNVEHTRRGDLSVDLISPHGVVSHIAVTRERDEARAGYKDWTFMSVAHW